MAIVEYFIKGLVIGFAIAAPVGPIGILCIRKTLTAGRASGFAAGLGAATADFLYGTIAAFGLTFVSDFLIRESFYLRLVGGIFLLYLGMTTFRDRPNAEPQLAASAGQSAYSADYTSTFILTLANPATIFSFLAIFAAFGVARARGNYVLASVLSAAVLIGSAIWWFLLSALAARLKSHLAGGGLALINRLSGAVLAVFGILALVSLI